MLKRLYVHNYKCLVNFEINFDKDISLFLGANGSGKSTVFEVLHKLRRIIIEEEKIDRVFGVSDSPRWLKNRNGINPTQFELDVANGKKIYKYKLIINDLNLFDGDGSFILEESLYVDNNLLVESKDDVTLFREGEQADFNVIRSSIWRYCSWDEHVFFDYLRNMFVVRIKPDRMASNITKASAEIETDLSNFAEWFALLNEKNRRELSVFEKVLHNILPGFDYFRIEQAGQVKVLQVDFENSANKKDIITYDFNELSEGQKVLIAIYTLIYCTPENSLICIDEPENFLALPEIQPWFDTLYDQCAERGLQALLISHHPRIINYLASDAGYWFYRENNLTRVKGITAEKEGGLSIAELVERGWIDDE